MKKTSARKRKRQSQKVLRPEYRFDSTKSKPNRFATQTKGSVAVVLEPDVAAVFKSSETVNTLLRSVISATSASKRNQAD